MEPSFIAMGSLYKQVEYAKTGQAILALFLFVRHTLKTQSNSQVVWMAELDKSRADRTSAPAFIHN